MQATNFSIPGLNLYTNPLSNPDGQVIRAVNVDSLPFGAKSKRPGYTTYNSSLGTKVIDQFTWRQENGTDFWNYASAGGTLFYSTQGTGAWTVAGNGTLTSGSHTGYAVLANTLTISQNGGTTRYTTNGTSFIDTPLAPAGEYLEQYQNRIYITGTSSTLFYSVTNDPTNWQTSGTSDSSSITIPGPAMPNKLFKLNNRLLISKSQQNLFRWDGFTLLDMASNMGLSSPYSYGTVESNGIWLNRLGVVISSGEQPVLTSNPIQPFIYNNTGSAMAGTSFDAAPATIHRYDYLLAAGTMTDDLTNETVPNGIIKYNFQKNEYLNYQFNDFPTTWNSYRDTNGVQQLLFSNSDGQVFQVGGLNDNGKPVEAILEMVFHLGAPHLAKNWRGFWGFFNPGCQAQIMYATSDTFIKQEKEWKTLGDARQGIVFFRFPTSSRSRFLYIKIAESSRNALFTFYGLALDADVDEEI